MGCRYTKAATVGATEGGSLKPCQDGAACDSHYNGSVKVQCPPITSTSGEATSSPSASSQCPDLTSQQKELIMDTWKLLVENISSVGVITFMNLFETHPDVQDVFMPFKGMSQDELRHSKELRAHGLRVMGSVQKVVARLDEPNKSEQLLKELGRNHVMYGAKVDYVDLIGPQFVYAVKPSLEENWSEDIEAAWLQLFRYMAYVMKGAMHDCVHQQQQQQHKDSTEHPEQ